jgi:hypothetical protein
MSLLCHKLFVISLEQPRRKITPIITKTSDSVLGYFIAIF